MLKFWHNVAFGKRIYRVENEKESYIGDLVFIPKGEPGICLCTSSTSYLTIDEMKKCMEEYGKSIENLWHVASYQGFCYVRRGTSPYGPTVILETPKGNTRKFKSLEAAQKVADKLNSIPPEKSATTA